MKTHNFKYYKGEKVCPADFQIDERAKFWHGEMMFSLSEQSLSEWIERAKEVIERLEHSNKSLYENAAKYPVEQFAIILFIEELFMKWNPYDDLKWVFKY